MHKEIFKKNKAFSILEIVVSGAVFVVVMTAVGYLLKESMFASRKSVESVKAMGLAKEGISVIETYRISNYGGLTDGNHGLSFSAGAWSLSGSSDVTDGYRRTVNIDTINTRLKLVVSKVEWTSFDGRTEDLTLTSYVTVWGPNGLSSYLVFDYRSAATNANRRNITTMTIRNNYSAGIVIARMKVKWVAGPTRLTSVLFRGTTVDNGSRSSNVEFTLNQSQTRRTLNVGNNSFELRFNTPAFSKYVTYPFEVTFYTNEVPPTVSTTTFSVYVP